MKTKKKQFFFNPENPKKSFDVYIDKDPSDTIPIKYKTYDDVISTIKKLEKLYKKDYYPHKRIFQVAMIMMVRLDVIVKRFNKGHMRYKLAKKYKDFLNKRTKEKNYNKRKKMVFHVKTKNLTKREILLNKCKLPKTKDTSHCFADGTHHTCCLLDKKARDYADRSGNPIGLASKKAFRKKNKRNPRKDELTPWCTCSGSTVCGYYSDRFKKTKIAFMNDPNKKRIARNIISQNCEKNVRDKMNVIPHITPGIENKNKNKQKCKNINYKSIIV